MHAAARDPQEWGAAQAWEQRRLPWLGVPCSHAHVVAPLPFDAAAKGGGRVFEKRGKSFLKRGEGAGKQKEGESFFEKGREGWKTKGGGKF